MSGSAVLRLSLALLVLAALCNVSFAAGPPGAQIRTFRHDTAEGCRFNVELAVSAEEIARGLMYRKELPEGGGMLFVFPDDDIRHFWMRNTLIPLDMIFIDSAFRVVTVHARAKPLDETAISSRVKARYVLEINGGKAARCGIVPGSRVEVLPAGR